MASVSSFESNKTGFHLASNFFQLTNQQVIVYSFLNLITRIYKRVK